MAYGASAIVEASNPAVFSHRVPPTIETKLTLSHVSLQPPHAKIEVRATCVLPSQPRACCPASHMHVTKQTTCVPSIELHACHHARYVRATNRVTCMSHTHATCVPPNESHACNRANRALAATELSGSNSQ
jgi:hypothetical protein